jgi:hypothetical protein
VINPLYDVNWIREKTAARWEKMMRAGQLSAHNVARLQKETGEKNLAGIKNKLQAFSSPLNPEQLARNEQLHYKLTPHVERHLGVTHTDRPAYYAPREDTIYASRGADDKFSLRYVPYVPPSAYRTTLEHEAAERRMGRAVRSGRYNPIANAQTAHYGPGAVIAERLGVQNPQTRALSDRLRLAPSEKDPFDEIIHRKLKQHGLVGNYVMPLGGRAHRSVDANLQQAAHLLRLKNQSLPDLLGLKNQSLSGRLGFIYPMKMLEFLSRHIEPKLDFDAMLQKTQPYQDKVPKDPRARQKYVQDFIATQSGG